MKVKVGDEFYKITFAHMEPMHSHYKMVTLCNVWKFDPIKDWMNLNYGMAKCGKSDNFCKETGRKLALSRALLAIDNKEVRTAIWNGYFERS